MSEKQIWDVLRCCVCGRYVHKTTRKIVPKPNHGVVMSHTYCDECKEKAMQEVRDLATEEMIRRWVNRRPVPPGVSERVRRRTLDHYERDELEGDAERAAVRRRIMADPAVRYGVLGRRKGGDDTCLS